MIDYEILGEVLIPLENGNFLGNKSSVTFQDLNKCNYKLFRKILFQGELLKFYITLQTSKQTIPNIISIFNKIRFNIEFESTEIDKNININKNEKNSFSNDDDVENDKPPFRFYSSNKNNEEDNNTAKLDFFKEFESINKREYDKDTFSQVYEIIKEICVPKDYINSNLLMKVNIYMENNKFFSENKDTDILNLYQLGILTNIEKYKLIKTIFKEVKVINALSILNLKQIEPKMDITLLQIKINNYDNYDLIDNSLKFSKIYKKLNSGDEPKINENNKNILIKDIRILQDETSFDEKATDNIEIIKDILIKEKKLLNKKDFNIILFNKNKYPYSISSGEELNLIIKIIKNPYINESVDSTNKINNNNNYKAKNAPVVLVTQNETTTQTEFNKIIINTFGDSNLHSSLLSNKKALEENINLAKFTSKRNSSIISINNLNKNILTQKVQEPLLSIGNLFKKKVTFNEHKNLNENKNNNNSNQDNNNKDSKNTTQDNNNYNMDNNKIDLDSYFDEHFKLYYITPVILDLSSDLFYENINMCIQLKWFNEINRYLILTVIIPEHINVNQYFEASIKIKNISFNPMNLIIQIKDNENQDAPISALSKNKNVENVPNILSQTKIEHFGLIDCGDEKIFSLKFLPLIQGYCYLPNLTLIDIYSERKFYVVQSNKIYVEDQNKSN